MLKLSLLLVMLHALHVAHSHHKIHYGWDINTPEQVRATRGSCLVIPCSYTFGRTSKTIKTYHGLWRKWNRGRGELQASASWATHPIDKIYKGRTYFLGQVWMKKCTWMLTGVRDSDAGFYYFRIEMPEYNSYTWSLSATEVLVVDAQRPDVWLSGDGAGGDVLAYCSVKHSCPNYRPTLTWNHNGIVLSGSQQLSDWQWITYSALQLRPEQNTPLELRCTVTYHGGQKLYSAVRYG